jgi:hypothetical protein
MKHTLLLLALSTSAFAQAPVIREGHGPAPELIEAANKLREAGQLLSIDQVHAQLDRASCAVDVVAVREKPLNGREIWDAARKAHVRIGYLYLCPRCKHWHMNLAGGYAISTDGAVATCHHVVANKEDMREGYLVAVSEEGRAMPVTEVLATSKFNDACIVRVKSEAPFSPLPLSTTAQPGDTAWCYSDPLGHPAYFSSGIVNRFYQHWHGEKPAEQFPRRMNVSTEWAPGSSGAAVLDSAGNAIGHVSEISAHGKNTGKNKEGDTLIVFHNAVCAVDVLALVHKPEKK